MNIKNNNGFTLVELIVVIAILAILAAVAVPAYSGYIQRANETADVAVIESLETSLNAAFAFHGLSVGGVTVTTAAGENNTYTLTFTFGNGQDAVAAEFANFADLDDPTGSANAKTVVATGLKNNFTYNIVNGALVKSDS